MRCVVLFQAYAVLTAANCRETDFHMICLLYYRVWWINRLLLVPSKGQKMGATTTVRVPVWWGKEYKPYLNSFLPWQKLKSKRGIKFLCIIFTHTRIHYNTEYAVPNVLYYTAVNNLLKTGSKNKLIKDWLTHTCKDFIASHQIKQDNNFLSDYLFSHLSHSKAWASSLNLLTWCWPVSQSLNAYNKEHRRSHTDVLSFCFSYVLWMTQSEEQIIKRAAAQAHAGAQSDATRRVDNNGTYMDGEDVT